MSRRTTRSTLAAAAAKAAASATASQKKSNNSSTNNKTSQLQQQQHTNTSSKKRRRVSPRRILSSRNQQVQENLRVIGASADTSNSKALHLLLEDATATGSSSSTEEVEGQEENNNSDDVVTSTRTTTTTRRKKRQRIMGSSSSCISSAVGGGTSRRAGGGGGGGGARAVDPDIPCISSEEEYSQQTTQTQAHNNNGSSGANSTSAVPVPINGTTAAAPAALPDLDLDPDPEAQEEEEEEASVSDGCDRSGDTEVDDAESQHSGASRIRNRSSRTCNKKRKRQVHQSVTAAKRRSTRFLDTTTTTSSNNGGGGFGGITRTSTSTGTFNKATTTATTPSRSLRACQQQPRNTNSSSNSNSKSNTTNRLDTTARNQGSSVNSIQVELISLLRTIRRKCDRHDIFSHPVNPEEDECPDYFDYVPKDQVMDLGTMENLIRNGTILNMDTFEVYMERILRCAKLYNTDEESFVFSQIEVLENESKPFIEKCRQKIEKMLLRGSPVKFTKEKSDDEENEDDPELEEDYNSSEEELSSSEVDETEFDDDDDESTESEDVDHCKVILKIPRGILSSKKQQLNKRRKQQRNDNNKKSKSKKTSTNNKLPKKKNNKKKQKQQRQQKRLSKSKNARKQVHQNEEQQEEDKDEDSSCVSLDNSVAGVDIPYCSHDLSESNVCAQHALSDWVSIIPEMVKVCNEAARRAKLRVNPSAVSFDKPLSENYIKDRLEFSGKVVCGYTVRATGAKSGASCAAGSSGQCIISRGRGRPPRQVAVSPSHHQGNKPHQVHEPLQGFVIVNKFITWRRTLEFTHPSFPASGMFPTDPQNHKCDNDGTIATQLELLPRYHHQDEEEGEDTTNSRNAKNDSDNKGPSPEGSIALERVAEIALLGGLGCGSYLLTRALQELDATRRFDYVCLQSTKIAIPFYERHGFVRVGAVARYNDDSELPFIPYRHWSEIVSGDVGVGAQQEVVEPSYMMALRLPSAAWSKVALSKLRVTLGSTPVIPPSPTTNRSASNATEEGRSNSIRETMIRNSSIRCLRTLLIQAFTLKMQRSIGSKITYQELLTLAKKYAEYAQEHKILTILNRALQESVTNTIGSSKAILRIVPGLAKVCSALLQDNQNISSVGGGGTDGCIKPFFSSSDIAMSRKKEVVVSHVLVDGQNILQEKHNDEDFEDNSVSLMALLSDTFFSGHSNNVEKDSNPVNDDKNHEGESEGEGEGNGNHQQQQKNMSTKKNNKKSDSNDNILVSSKGRSRRNEVNGNIFYCEINVRIKLLSDYNDEEDDAYDGDNKQEQSFDEPLVAVVRS